VTATPRERLESELFGHEGGPFTGGRTDGQPGKFELAGRGTLVIDEIGDMPLDTQDKLLRVLQEGTVQRLGSGRETPVQARVIATTRRELERAVREGNFRLDLHDRLGVVHLRLPPLRELARRASEDAIVRFGGNVAYAARALGVARGTLYAKLKRYGIPVPESTPTSVTVPRRDPPSQ